MSLPPNPNNNDIDNFVSTASKSDLEKKYSSIVPGLYGLYHPADEYLKKQIEKKLNSGGRRRSSKSSKKQSARRLRRGSSKARKARTTRRKY